jgi:hypothetical protein
MVYFSFFSHDQALMFSFMLITLPGCYKEIHGKGEEVIKQLL